MPADRQPRTMDNPYYDWAPIVARSALRWPNDSRVAFCVIVNLELFEWLPPKSALVPPSAVRYGPYPLVYDVHEISHHEYGNRVGIFRVMEVLDRYGIRATAAVDAGIVEKRSFLVRQCLQRDWELIGHGLTSSRMINERMSEDEEREYIEGSLNALERASGSRPEGWLGVDYGESTRTVKILAELGVQYVCDWPNDEQPYRMKVPTGQMVSLPVALELDEVVTHRERGVPIHGWKRMVTETLDRLHEDGAETGRLLVLNLHPYLIGQPFRIKYLDQVIQHIAEKDGVWVATGSEIVRYYLEAP